MTHIPDEAVHAALDALEMALTHIPELPGRAALAQENT